MAHNSPRSKRQSKRSQGVVLRPQFYRGRTSVTSEAAAKQQAQKAYRRKKLSQQRRDLLVARAWRWGRRVIVVGLIGFLLMQAWLSGDVIFRNNTLSTTSKLRIEQVVGEHLGQGYNRFVFTLNKDQLAQQILEALPDLESVDVSVSWFGRAVSVHAQPARALYVFSSPQVVREVERAWVSENGVLSGTSLAAEAPDLAITLIDDTGVEYSLGDQVLSAQQLAFLEYANINLERQELHLTQVRLDATPRQMRLYVAEHDYYFVVSTDRSSEVLATELSDALRLIEDQGITVREYIDLTVTDKVFYK